MHIRDGIALNPLYRMTEAALAGFGLQAMRNPILTARDWPYPRAAPAIDTVMVGNHSGQGIS